MANRTLDWLMSQGRGDLVGAVQSGALNARDALRRFSEQANRSRNVQQPDIQELRTLTPAQQRAVMQQLQQNPGMSMRDALTPQGADDPRGFFDQSQMQGGAGQAVAMGQGADDNLAPAGDLSRPTSATGDSVEFRRIAEAERMQRNALNGLQSIMDEIQSRPELLDDAHTLRGKAQTGILRLRDRSGIDAIDIDPEQEERLGEVAAYRQRLLTNVNQYIKDITGAQVGQGDETRRLMAVQPNANDSPSELIAKLEGAVEMARLNIIRNRVMQMENMSEAPTDMQIREMLRQRGKEAYDAAIAAGLSPTDARLRAAQQLNQEFGF